MALIAIFLASNMVAQESPKKGGSLNLQHHSNVSELLYGKESSLVQNLPLTTTTLEGNGWDPIGSTYFFIDFEAGNAANLKDPYMGMYFEFTREWCFWGKSKVAGLTIHTEIDQVVGYGMMPQDFTTNLLPGIAYSHVGEKLFWQVQLLYRHSYSAASGHAPGAQMTWVWCYTPTAWFELSGYADFMYDSEPYLLNGKGLKIAIEPYVWFKLNDSFALGSRLRATYNCYQDFIDYQGARAYFAPTIAVRWRIL